MSGHHPANRLAVAANALLANYKGISKISAADTFQVRLLAQERFIQQSGLLTNPQMDAIGKALATFLAIK